MASHCFRRLFGLSRTETELADSNRVGQPGLAAVLRHQDRGAAEHSDTGHSNRYATQLERKQPRHCAVRP